jgi:hypothetical protein
VAVDVAITKVRGNGYPVPTSITVWGTATGCEEIEVSWPCAAEAVRKAFPTGGPNNWTVDLPNDNLLDNDRCACGAEVEVTARCSNPLNTNDPPVVFTTVLDCDGAPPAAVCHDVALSAPAVLPCWGRKPGLRKGTEVQFDAPTTPATPQFAGSYTWEVKDASGQSLAKITSTSASFRFDFPAAGDFYVSVVIVTPGCPNPVSSASRRVTILNCYCPSLTGDLVVRDLGRPDGEGEFDCEYEFAAQAVGASASTLFEWDFGDGETATTSTPVVRHSYSSGARFFVTLTMKTPGGRCPDAVLKTDAIRCGEASQPKDDRHDGGGGCLCALILALSLFLLGAAVALTVVAGCMANLAAGIAAVIAFGLGLALLAVWGALCGDLSACSLLNGLMRTIKLAIYAGGVSAGGLGLGHVFGELGLGCFAGAAIGTGELSLVYQVLDDIARRTGCLVEFDRPIVPLPPAP